jgi:hypothetical protein
VQVIRRRLDPEDHRLRDWLTRADQPYEFYESDSPEALELLARCGIPEPRPPLVVDATASSGDVAGQRKDRPSYHASDHAT